MPLFTVVIPTYNRAEFIGAGINSVLTQDFDDFEIIVVDDGSTDDTEAVMQRACARASKIRYVKQKNSERGVARNRGVAEACGEYVVFLDSDDQMHHDHLSALKEIIDQHPGINFLATKYEFIRNGVVRSANLDSLREGYYGSDYFLLGAPIASFFCIRKENPKLKLFEEDRQYATSEDWMFLVQNLVDDQIYIGNRVTVLMNDHDDRSMRRDHNEVIHHKLLGMQWIEKNVPLGDKQRRLLEGHTYYFCAIHSYLDNNRRAALRYLNKAMKSSGIDAKLAVLFLKVIIGRKIVRVVRARLAASDS